MVKKSSSFHCSVSKVGRFIGSCSMELAIRWDFKNGDQGSGSYDQFWWLRTLNKILRSDQIRNNSPDTNKKFESGSRSGSGSDPLNLQKTVISKLKKNIGARRLVFIHVVFVEVFTCFDGKIIQILFASKKIDLKGTILYNTVTFRIYIRYPPCPCFGPVKIVCFSCMLII